VGGGGATKALAVLAEARRRPASAAEGLVALRFVVMVDVVVVVLYLSTLQLVLYL